MRYEVSCARAADVFLSKFCSQQSSRSEQLGATGLVK